MMCVWNSYYIHLSVIYFSSVRIKMAARDGDMPLWPAKHWPWQIPLFIHKLDLLSFRGRVVRLGDACDLSVDGGYRICVWIHEGMNLG